MESDKIGWTISMNNEHLTAKAIFLKYDGDYFHMGQDELYEQYKAFNIPASIEKNGLLKR